MQLFCHRVVKKVKPLLELKRSSGSIQQCISATDGQNKVWFAVCCHFFVYPRELKICMSAALKCYIPTACGIGRAKWKPQHFAVQKRPIKKKHGAMMLQSWMTQLVLEKRETVLNTVLEKHNFLHISMYCRVVVFFFAFRRRWISSDSTSHFAQEKN